MARRIQHRRGTTAQWSSANPILATGEIGVDLTLNRFKMGDGVTAWNSLAYIDDIVTADITDGSVTTVKVADANITTGKLADGSVTTVKVADSNITTGKLADLNVTTGKLADLSVTTGKIAAGAVTSAKIDATVATAASVTTEASTRAAADTAESTARSAADTLRDHRSGIGPGVYMYDGLRNWRYSSKLIRDVVCFGDSLSGVGYSYGWGKKLRQRFNVELNGGDIGDGHKPQRHPDWSYAGGLTWPFMPTSDSKDRGIMGTRYTGTLVTDGGPGVRATFTPPAGTNTDLIDLYWIDGGLLVFGNWRYSIDGGATWANLDATSGYTRVGDNSLQSFTITGPITTSFIIESSTNGINTVGCAFAGIGLRSSSVTRGIRLHEWGAGGRYLADLMRTTSGNAINMLGKVTPDLSIVIFSNDALLNNDPTNFGTLLTNLVGGARVFYNSLMDFVFVCPPEQGDVRASMTATQALYRAKSKEVAQTVGGVAVLDLAEAWGTYTEAYADGYMDADLIHLSEKGNLYVADQLSRMIL